MVGTGVLGWVPPPACPGGTSWPRRGARPAVSVDLDRGSEQRGPQRMASSVVDRLVDAINGHDLDRLTECFAPGFSMLWPVHPARSFTGRDGVRTNWEAIFTAYPGLRVTVTTRAQRGEEIWGEWEFKGEHRDGGPPFWQRGVIIVVAEGEVIVQSRFYMEPVELDELDQAVRAQLDDPGIEVAEVARGAPGRAADRDLTRPARGAVRGARAPGGPRDRGPGGGSVH